jgi:hypothetical protein
MASTARSRVSPGNARDELVIQQRIIRCLLIPRLTAGGQARSRAICTRRCRRSSGTIMPLRPTEDILTLASERDRIVTRSRMIGEDRSGARGPEWKPEGRGECYQQRHDPRRLRQGQVRPGRFRPAKGQAASRYAVIRVSGKKQRSRLAGRGFADFSGLVNYPPR